MDGYPGEYDHPYLEKAMGGILDLCPNQGAPFGTTASGPEAGARWIAEGYYKGIVHLFVGESFSNERIS